MLVNGGISFTLPFVTKNVIDKGVLENNINVVILMLSIQLLLYLSISTVNYTKAWVMLKFNNKLSITILDDFIRKLLRLPVSFFDAKKLGEMQQRLDDHGRVQSFITSFSLSLLLTVINFVAYSSSLVYFSFWIFITVLSFSIINILWITYFLPRRRLIDNARFNVQGNTKDKVLEIVNGAQDIKINGAAEAKVKNWYSSQEKVLSVGVMSLKIEQGQSIGAFLIGSIENITITFICAYSVIYTDMTIGTMVSIGVIAGSLKASLQQLVSIVRSYQDASISLNRLMEIHNMRDEDADLQSENKQSLLSNSIDRIHFKNVSFRYPNTENDTLSDINIGIEKGTTIGLVGASGSGKSTFIKLLLKYYKPTKGFVEVNGMSLSLISANSWRSHCAVVMQDGFIFTDTIKDNICLSGKGNDRDFLNAVHCANIDEYIDGLDNKYNTVIGNKGVGLSGGQKQRILIARALCRDAELLILDEATSMLDSKNENEIFEKINKAYPDMTKIYISHRLHTLVNADVIYVFDNGRIIESGTHNELKNANGKYSQLLKYVS